MARFRGLDKIEYLDHGRGGGDVPGAGGGGGGGRVEGRVTARVAARFARIVAGAKTDDQRLRALEAVARAEVSLPADAFVVGEPVTADAIAYGGHPRAGLTLICSRGQRHFSVGLADVAFPPGRIPFCGMIQTHHDFDRRRVTMWPVAGSGPSPGRATRSECPDRGGGDVRPADIVRTRGAQHEHRPHPLSRSLVRRRQPDRAVER